MKLKPLPNPMTTHKQQNQQHLETASVETARAVTRADILPDLSSMNACNRPLNTPRTGEGKFIRLNRIRSHVGYSRWLSEAQPTGEYLARVQTEDIPSPYAYSPSVTIYDWHNWPVVVFE